MAPRCPSMAPRWPQEEKCITHGALECFMAFRGCSIAEMRPQDGPTCPQDGPAIAQDGPKMAPRCPQDGRKILHNKPQNNPKMTTEAHMSFFDPSHAILLMLVSL